MNRNQWIALAVWFLIIGGIMQTSVSYFGTLSPIPIAECYVHFVISLLVGKLVGAIFIILSIACWICGWLEKEGAR